MAEIGDLHERAGSQLETAMHPTGFIAGNKFSESLRFFVGSQSLVLMALILMPSPVPFALLWPLLFVMWILSAASSLYHIDGRVHDPSAVMVRYGTLPKRTVAWEYSLLIASIPGNILASLIMENWVWSNSFEPIGWSVPVLHAASLFFVVLAGIAVWKGNGIYANATRSRTVYVSPTQYDAFRSAQIGQVILGQELRHAVQTRVSVPDLSSNALPGEVTRRTVEAWAGEDRAFILDLEHEINSHAALLGPTGLGKTEAVKAIVIRNWLAKKIPSLILDLRGDYTECISQIGGIVWTVPANFTVNPLMLGGFSPVERAAELEESSTYVIGLSPLQATEVYKVAIEAYRARGILQEDPSTWCRNPPVWNDIIGIFESRIKTGYYHGQQQESVTWTVRKLHRVSRVFGEEDHEFFDVVLRIPVAINLSGLKGTDIAKVMFAYVILQRIYDHFDLIPFSELQLFVIVDEAHLLFKTESQKGAVTQEPLPVRIIRLGRKYGFGVVFASQLASDLPEAAIANAATVIAFNFDQPRQVAYVRKSVKLSASELDIYENLQRGACFVKRLGCRHANLVKVQMISGKEIKAAKTLTDLVRLSNSKESQRRPDVAIQHERSTSATNEPALIDQGSGCFHDAKSTEEGEFTSLEKQILRSLEIGPVTMKELTATFPNVGYRKMTDILDGLIRDGSAQDAKVANLQGKGTVFYSSLRANWLQSESLEHRAMVRIIAAALAHLHPNVYWHSADAPDIGLEGLNPKACLEVETNRKKLTSSELEKWAEGVKQRNTRLGYDEVLVVVPNVAVEARYKDACARHGLELVTIAKLGAKP
ncbi:MAG: ATP-binding protein [Candidatus Bathyarchaeia archaeon]